MDDKLLQDLNEIADFVGERLPTTMVGLKKELEGTPAWVVIQILGSYIHYRLDAQQVFGIKPEHYGEVHNHALAHTLALPLTQDFMKSVMTDAFNTMAGVSQETPTYDLGRFEEENR